MADGEDVLTTAEVAEIFEVKVNTVRQWVKRNLMVPLPEKVKQSNGEHSLVFAKDELKRFAEERYGNAK